MKAQLAQLTLLTIVLSALLWQADKWFLGDAVEDTSSKIDVRSTAHLRSSTSSNGASATGEGRASSAKTANVTQLAAQRISPADSVSLGAAVATGKQKPILNSNGDNAAQAVQTDDKTLVVHLSEDEVNERERARRKRLKELGLIVDKPPEPTTAIDVSLVLPAECDGADISSVPIGLKFRYESAIVKGESLNALESLVAYFRQCSNGRFVLAENPLGKVDASEMLTQMRLDEIKYFFIQHSIDIDAVEFPENQ